MRPLPYGTRLRGLGHGGRHERAELVSNQYYCGVWVIHQYFNHAPNTTYEAITCQACHDPHDASNPHQLRMSYNVALSDGTVVTNAGAGGFCMECHNSRNGSVTNMHGKISFESSHLGGRRQLWHA